MEHERSIVLLISAIALFLSACVSEPSFDKAKFADLGRTTEDIKTAITSNKPCDVPETLEQRLASGSAAAVLFPCPRSLFSIDIM